MNAKQPVHPDPLLEQLRLFNHAAEAFTRQWSLTQDDGNHPIVMCDKYPFDESFDEIALQIHEWYQAALKYQPSDYENLLTTRAAQYNTTREVVKRATDAFWFTEGDAAIERDCQQAQAAGAAPLDNFSFELWQAHYQDRKAAMQRFFENWLRQGGTILESFSDDRPTADLPRFHTNSQRVALPIRS